MGCDLCVSVVRGSVLRSAAVIWKDSGVKKCVTADNLINDEFSASQNKTPASAVRKGLSSYVKTRAVYLSSD